MPIINAFSKAVVRDFSLEELEDAARLMRGYDLVTLCAAGVGDAGGTLSIMDLVAALYLRVAVHDPNHPQWPHRDRIVWPDGHKLTALHLALAFANYFSIEDITSLRELDSPWACYPDRRKLPGAEVLSQGHSSGVGMAIAAKLDNEEHTVFCIMGDDELQEPRLWEAAEEASYEELDNLVVIIECNRVPLGRPVECVTNVVPLSARYRRAGWEVIEIDGNDMRPVVAALQKAKNVPVLGKPTVIIANTVKGKGVSFMENVAGWHGKAPSYDEMVNALGELGLKDTIAYDALLRQAKEYQSETTTMLTGKVPHFRPITRGELVREFELTAERVARKATELLASGRQKRKRADGAALESIQSRLKHDSGRT